MKNFTTLLAILLLGCLTLLWQGCQKTQESSTEPSQAVEPPKAVEAPKAVEPPKAAEPSKGSEPSNIVATIGDYVITGPELQKKVISKLKREPDMFVTRVEPIEAKSVLLEMIAEKATIMDAREKNLLKDHTYVKKYRNKRLVNMLLSSKFKGKITVSEDEINQKLKENPNLTRQKAASLLKRQKGNALVDEYYNQIYKALNVKKLNENFPKTAQIYKRLLMESRRTERMVFVRTKQIKEKTTQEEKDIMLATFDGGKFTVKDWFDYLTEKSPPSRPRNKLVTAEGVNMLLEEALKTPLFVLEAESKGLDKDENLLKRVKDYEDRILLGLSEREITENIKELTDANEIAEYYEKHSGDFKRQDRMKTDQIFCEDLKTAKLAKQDLESGSDFNSVKQEYSLKKDLAPRFASLDHDSMFFEQLWNNEPNDIVSPVKGLYGNKVAWRIVKILQKIPGKPREYKSKDDMKNDVNMKRRQEIYTAAMNNHRKQILDKYPYKIYEKRIKDYDPLNIP